MHMRNCFISCLFLWEKNEVYVGQSRIVRDKFVVGRVKTSCNVNESNC